MIKKVIFTFGVRWPLMTGLHYHLGYSMRLLARCERDKVCTNVDIHTLVWESSITRQDIWDILVSFDLGLIYRHVSESFETRQEQVESMEDETNVPFTLSFSSCLDENVNQALHVAQGPSGCVANKVRDVPKYRSSDTLPAPEIFLL